MHLDRSQLFLGSGLVILALIVIGFLFADELITHTSTTPGWATIAAVPAGGVLNDKNIHHVTVGNANGQYMIYSKDPRGRRANLSLSSGHLIAADDLLPTDTAEVTIPIVGSPTLAPGDRVDIYVLDATKTKLLGCGSLISYLNAGSVVLEVKKSDEPLWVTILATHAALYAAKSDCYDVKVPIDGLDQQIAFNQLASEASKDGSTPSPNLTPSPSPSASPSNNPKPSPSPTK